MTTRTPVRALLLLLVISLCSANCALALRGAGAGALGGRVVMGGLRGAALARPALGLGTATRAGVTMADLATVRSAGGALFSSRTAVTAARTRVVAADGSVLGIIEHTSTNRMLIRGAESGLEVNAVRAGSRVTYRLHGQTVGFSELRSGRIHHYVRTAGTDEFVGHDVIRGGRVFQYDADGLLITDTALTALRRSSGSATVAGVGLLTAPAAAIEAAARNREKQQQIAAQIRAVQSQISTFTAGGRRQ
jgi:hypothetical protein